MKKSTLIDRYAHDYWHMNLGEDEIRAMLTEYTREVAHHAAFYYEDAMDDVGGMEITEGMQKFVTIFIITLSVALGFIIGIAVGAWLA